MLYKLNEAMCGIISVVDPFEIGNCSYFITENDP